jgi:hypothetical protein
MSTEENQPRDFDAVLGGETPPPLQGVVLGGIEGVKRRLASPIVQSRIDAVKEAFQHGKEGFNLAISALQDESPQVGLVALEESLQYGNQGLDLVIKELDSKYRIIRHRAAQLLHTSKEARVKSALNNYKFWAGFERLNGLPNSYVNNFANRKVIEYNVEQNISYENTVAYALRDMAYNWRRHFVDGCGGTCADKFESLIRNHHCKRIEALVFGLWNGFNDNSNYHPVATTLADAKKSLKNLKAVFIGDIDDDDCMISSIKQSNVSPILEAYPNLEVLKIRGDSGGYPHASGLGFDPLKHNKLKALIVESGGLRKEAVNQICNLELPRLEYLELWLGRDEYGGTSSIEDVMPIINGIFPKLKYLGLRNSEYSDDIAIALADSPILENLIDLDFSMGTLGDEAAEVLLSCSALNELDTLDISENCLSIEMINKFKQLDIQIIADGYQKGSEDRYCSVAE